MPVPDRFEDRVRKAEIEDVLDRFLPEVVIDAEDCRLGEVLVQYVIEPARRCEVVPKRLLDDDPRILRAFRLGQLPDDGGEHARRNREGVRRPAATVKLSPEPRA